MLKKLSKYFLSLALCLPLIFGAGSAFALTENFDSYSPGLLTGQGGWQCQDNQSCQHLVTNSVSSSPPNSLQLNFNSNYQTIYKNETIPIVGTQSFKVYFSSCSGGTNEYGQGEIETFFGYSDVYHDNEAAHFYFKNCELRWVDDFVFGAMSSGSWHTIVYHFNMNDKNDAWVSIDGGERVYHQIITGNSWPTQRTILFYSGGGDAYLDDFSDDWTGEPTPTPTPSGTPVPLSAGLWSGGVGYSSLSASIGQATAGVAGDMLPVALIIIGLSLGLYLLTFVIERFSGREGRADIELGNAENDTDVGDDD